MILVCVALLCLGRVEESEAKIVVGGLIPSVLAVVHHRHAIVAVAEIRPALRVHFVSIVDIVAAFYGAKSEVVCRLGR